MSEEISHMMATEIGVQHEHLRNITQLQGQEPNLAMRMNQEELLATFGELTQISHPMEGLTPSAHSSRIAYLGKPYPPCVVALSELKPTSLSEMKLEIHHRGHFIILKTLSEPKQLGSLMIATEDGNGDVCAVSLFHSRLAVKILRNHTFLALKEPYLTLSVDGKIMIRVDHPSDLIRLDSDSRFLPVSMTAVPIPLFSPTERQNMGDAAFQRGHLQVAIDFYTRGLGIKQYNQEVRRSMYLSRAQARFDLGHYELAVQDAIAAITRGEVFGKIKDRNLNAFYLAGQASYELEDYGGAKKFFSRVLKTLPESDYILAQIRQVQKRLAEQNTGEYDFSAMSKSVSKNHRILDHASFVKNTKIASSGNRGRGLFATKHLKPGELILVEKAFYSTIDQDDPDEIYVVSHMHEDTPNCYRGRYSERVFGLVEKILCNPKQAERFLDLHDGGGFDKIPKFADSVMTIDTFLVEAISRLNAFGVPGMSATGDDEPDATGIWLHASHANHSCIPNAERTFIGDIMILRATRDIGLGEEVYLSYCDQDDPYPKRKEHLSAYGFQCDCPLCMAEEDIPEMLNKRAYLVNESNSFITTHMPSTDVSKPPRTIISAAAELLRQLEGTYPEARYHRLPRLECVPLSYWLCLANGTPEEKLRRALNALRNHGYFIETTNRVRVDRATAVPLGPAIMIAFIATAASLQLGKIEAAGELQKFQKEIYVVFYGCDNGFEDMNGQFGV